MSAGLKHGVEHGKAKLELAAIKPYDPEANTKYVAALHALKALKYPIVDQLEKLKDAPIDLIMVSLYLESNSREDTPQWIHELRPSSSQLKIPVYPEARNPKDPWSFKEEILSDGVSVSVPIAAPQGLSILLADAATHTEISEDEASPRLLRSKSLPPIRSRVLGLNKWFHEKEKGSPLRFIALLNWFHEAQMITKNDVAKKSGGILIDSPQKEQEEVHTDKDVSEQVEHEVNEVVSESSRISFPTASSKESSKRTSTPTVETAVPTISTHVPTASENIFTIDPSEPPSTPTVETTVPTVSTPVPTIIKSRGGLKYSQPPSISNVVSSENKVEDFFGDSTHATRLNEVEADLNNMETAIQRFYLKKNLKRYLKLSKIQGG
ncbi:hypothetical protein Tco_1339088 [Tanacetum coccineum]